MSKVQVAFSNLYMEALNQLEGNVQSKVNQAVLKLMSNPDLPGLNREKIHQAKDPSIQSIRVNDTYRIILSAQDQGRVFLLLWVDHHDDAYAWAASHKCKINPNTGTIQIYQAEIEESTFAVPQPEAAKASLFLELKDRQLLKLGVPEELLVLVRGVTNDGELDAIQTKIPVDAYESLFFYIAGQTYEDILADKAQSELSTSDQSFDTDDFSAALSRLQNRASIFVPESESALNAVMNASLEKWRVFLHPSQRTLVEGIKNGPVRVLGGAGTGKTVAAMHRAQWLASRISTSNKILFTTFTKNLAQDIAQNLKSICHEEYDKIEVINLDRWVSQFLRKHGYDYQLALDNEQLKKLWDQAYSEKPSQLDFKLSFFREEWSQVVQAQGISSLDEYKRASRIGRGTKLSREQKADVWRVFEEYRTLLNKYRLKEVDDAYRDATQFIKTNSIVLNFSSIIVDEAQDMGMAAFSLLRTMVPEQENDLFIVGDAHQRIYGRKVVLSKAGINIRGRSKKLKINYRTTDEIRQYAVSLLHGVTVDDLDGSTDNNQLYKSLTHGPKPIHEHFLTLEDQVKYISLLLKDDSLEKGNNCVVARANSEVARLIEGLEKQGISCFEIKTSDHNAPADAVKVATFHRVKGLEFDRVILASINKGLVPLEAATTNLGDDSAYEDAQNQERALLYVALTRAKKEAYILSYGEASEFLDDI
ncbi:MAG: DNA helicase [Thiotrichales bacterium 34-46-19]|nr:MAG: DNA helicase [Thiotrichales bacterium 17-46-47]OZA96572.1 MAG: DNA helicase [Thiotrichales bacterium 34-46-19]HQT01969.1 3'-5' exonuclease [Thiotrichales bacterium]HQT04089.1 3'-5' exonuclease [Thiotrichales bacterium]